jgi:uncharacterized membrane protein
MTEKKSLTKNRTKHHNRALLSALFIIIGIIGIFIGIIGSIIGITTYYHVVGFSFLVVFIPFGFFMGYSDFSFNATKDRTTRASCILTARAEERIRGNPPTYYDQLRSL